jgi:hypothetical protein
MSGAGNGKLLYDLKFSPSDPPGGPYWNSINGSCYRYISSNQVAFPLSASCSPSNNTRTDISTADGNILALQPYTKGQTTCTTVPVYLPSVLPDEGSGSWFQVAEMKDNSSHGGDWKFHFVDEGVNAPSVGFSGGGGYDNTDAWVDSGPASAGWHTFSICTNNSDVVYGIWYDGVRETFNQGPCAGLLECTGLNLFYDGRNTQPLVINAYTSGNFPNITIIHGDPLIATMGSNGLPPEPRGGWNSP